MSKGALFGGCYGISSPTVMQPPERIHPIPDTWKVGINMVTKKILVACGTGGITSRNIGLKIKDYLADKGVEANVETCKLVEVKDVAAVQHPDLVCSASALPALDCPTVRATAILTGVGADRVLEQIYDLLK